MDTEFFRKTYDTEGYDEFVQAVSRTYMKIGEMLPTFFCFSTITGQSGQMILECIPEEPELRDKMVAALKAGMGRFQVTHYFMAVETWYTAKEEGAPFKRPSQDPERREGIFFGLCDAGGMIRGSMREIVRSPEGKPTLADIEHWDMSPIGGRFANLLGG